MNWKVRIKNKLFWMTIIPAVFLLIQMILSIFGINVNFDELQGKILATVDALFSVLAILGIVTDMTTHGVGDSERALGYERPYKDQDIDRDDDDRSDDAPDFGGEE
jgi:phi LC3 family holin